MRMVTRLSVIVAAVCLLAAAQSRLKSDEEGKILALENAWNLAEAHKDINALDHLLAENVVYIEYDGTLMNKSQFLASIKDSSYRPGQIVNENMSVHVYGDIAIVTAAYWEKGLEKGKPYFRRAGFADTWIYRNGLWQCVASQSTPISR